MANDTPEAKDRNTGICLCEHDRTWIVVALQDWGHLRRHLLENLDDNPADGTERPRVKKKPALPTYILCNPPSLSFLARCTHILVPKE